MCGRLHSHGLIRTLMTHVIWDFRDPFFFKSGNISHVNYTRSNAFLEIYNIPSDEWEILKLLISRHPGAPAWHYLESFITPNVLSQGDQEVAVIAGSWEKRHRWQPTVIYPKAVMTSFSPHEKHKLGLSLMEVPGFSVSQRSLSFSVSYEISCCAFGRAAQVFPGENVLLWADRWEDLLLLPHVSAFIIHLSITGIKYPSEILQMSFAI